MKERKKPRTIQIPLWMDNAVYELASQHKRSIGGEIGSLVESAIREYIEGEQISNPARVLRKAAEGRFPVGDL
jgi:hypothetical protein